MEIELISGRYTAKEAEQLLSSIIQAKIKFHESKINTLRLSEEDIKHSEKRISQLQDRLAKIIKKISEGGKEYTDIQAHIEINFAPVLTP